MDKMKLKKDTVVFWEGDPGVFMYHIRWGSIGIYAHYATSRQRLLAELREGDYFGEMGLIDKEPRSATAVVLESGTQLDRVSEAEFAQFFSQRPEKVYDIIQQLSNKLRKTTRDYMDVCQSVADAVGTNADAVDDSSDYNFWRDERLRTIHDRLATEHEE